MIAQRRSQLLPIIGVTLLFAALGPLIGGALFIPLAVVMEAPLASGVVGHVGAIATLIAHTFAIIGAYFVGIGPAAATGFLYALWDAAAPARWPRALVAAAIGGAMTQAMFVWLASLGASVEASVAVEVSPTTQNWIDTIFSGSFDDTLRHVFVASGAVAGFVCAMATNLVGLTLSPPSNEARAPT